MASPRRSSTPSGAATGHQTPPRLTAARPVEHMPTPSPRASRTRPRKDTPAKTLLVHDADGRLVKRPVVLDHGVIEEVRAANASKDVPGFERAALEVWADIPLFLLEGARAIFMLSEPISLAEFEDDQLVCPSPPPACHDTIIGTHGVFFFPLDPEATKPPHAFRLPHSSEVTT